MHRLTALVLFALFAVVVSSQAQQTPGRPGGEQPLALPCEEDCGGGDTQAPTIELLAPGSQVTQQYPTITIQFCDNVALDGGTRQIKVNGVDRTALFTYVTPGFSECAVGEEKQSSTTQVALSIGNNTVWAYICDTSDHCTTNQWTIERLAGPVPVVSLAPYSADLQDYGRCAMACFAATYAQSTVPYFSLDTPRNVTLVYNGDRVDPKPFVHVNVTHTDGSSVPQYFQLRIRKADQTYITFLNGESTLRFTAAVGTWRLGGQFDPAANSMSADVVHPVTVVVGAVYGADVVETTVATRVIVLNENDAPIARGWTLAGIQRLYPQAGGSALIAEGEGSATYFQKVASVFVSPAGDFSRLTVTGTGNGTVYTRAYPDSTKVRFNYLGYMLTVTDRFGNRDSIQYQGNAPWRIIDPNGTAHQLTYNVNGLSSIAALGRTTTITVQANRTLTAITDPDNVATQFGYDASLRLRTVTNRNGVAVSTLTYHANSGKVVADSGPSVPMVVGSARPGVSFAPWQHVGVPYTATLSPAPAASPVRSDTVRATITDPAAHATRFTVNAFGQPLVTTGALNDTVTVLYTAAGLPDSVMPNTGVRSGYDFNGSGLPTRVTVGALTTNIAYQAGWDVPSQVSGDAQPTVTQTFSISPRYLATSVGGAPNTYRRLDWRGRDSVVTDPESHQVLRRWYAGTNGNVSKDSSPGGRVRIYGYDTYGRRTWDSVPGFARRNVLTYDAVNRVTQVRDTANAAPTVYSYDNLYLRAVTDPAGNRDSTYYNALGWPIAHRDALGKRDSVWYDVEGQVRRTRGRLGVADTVVYTYDAGHRLRARRGALIAADTVAYSAADTVVSVSNANSRVTTYVSGIRRQVDSVVTWLKIPGQDSVHYVHRYVYRGSGPTISLLDSAYAIGPIGMTFLSRRLGYDTTTFSLDSLWFGGARTLFTRDDDNLVPTTTLPGGETIINGIMASHSTGSLNSQVLDDDYSFDRRGRVVEHQTAPNATTTQGYDRVDRLASRMFRSGLGTCYVDPEFGSFCYAIDDSLHLHGYDALGNRTSSRGVLPDSVSGTWQDTIPVWSVTGTYTTGNRIQTFAGCSYAHDNAGNRIRQVCGTDSTRYYWNGDGRLTSLKRSGGDSVAFAYDPLGRVVRRTVNGVVASNFLWEGDNLQAELTATGMARLSEYSYYGMDRLHAFMPWAQAGYGLAYAHQDAAGNVRGLSSGTGAVRRTYQYDEFGALIGGTSVYPGEAHDRARWKGALSLGPEANLYYMRNRWYDTKTGRFLSEDPIGLAGGLNLYAFAGGDPLNGFDPLGLLDTISPVNIVAGEPICPGGFRWSHFFRRCVESGAAAHGSDDAGYGSGDEPTELAPPSAACIAAVGFATVSSALDLATIAAPGVFLARAGARALLTRAVAGQVVRAGGVRTAEGTMLEGVMRETWAAAASDARAAAPALASNFRGSLPASWGTAGAAPIATGSFSWRDLVPVYGSIRAWQSAAAVCHGT